MCNSFCMHEEFLLFSKNGNGFSVGLFRDLLFSMILIAIAITLTTIVLNLHYRKPSTHKMPGWVRRLFIQKLPRFLLMRVPLQVIKDSMKSRRSKFLRHSDPALQSLAGKHNFILCVS